MFSGVDALIGQTIGNHRIESVIGSGATGAVFLAREVNNRSASPVALKILIPPLQASTEVRSDFRKRFLLEAQILRQLDHPHILKLLDFGEDPTTQLSYMVLPYIDGGTVADLASHGPLPLDQVSTIISQIAEALDYAHARALIHRDIKPGNILINSDG